MLELRFADWRANCASSITFVPSCLFLSRILRVEDQISEGAFKSWINSLEDGGCHRQQRGEESEVPHKHTFTRSDSRFKMHPHRFYKAKSSRLRKRTEGERYSQTSACVGVVPPCMWVWMCCTPCHRQAALRLPHAKHTNSSSQWNQRMKSLQGTLGTEGTQGGKRKRERRLF